MTRDPPLSTLLRENTIVDTDVHLPGRSIAMEHVPERLEQPYRSQVENSFGGAIMSTGWDRGMGGKIEMQSIDGPGDIQEKLMEKFHIDVPILSSSLHMTRIPDDDLAVQMMSAFNDALIELYLDPAEEFRGLAVAATQDPDAVAAEIDRIGDERQIVGVILVPTGAAPPLGDESYDVMYDAAQDQGLAVAYHAAAGAFPLEFPRQFHGLKRFASVHALSHVWSHMLTIMSLLENGTPEKFPGINYVFLEGGIGWLPSMMFRLNKEYAIRRGELPLLRKRPEEYIRDFYFSSQPLGEAIDPAGMRKVLDLIGATDTLMFSSDFPHWDFDSPDELAQHLQTSFDPADRERILSTNAADAFGLSI